MKRDGEVRAPSINVTPLIDILLVLLIIFMILTPLRPARFKAYVPSPPPDDPLVHQSPRTLVVVMDGDSRLRLILAGETVAEGSVGDSESVSSRLAEEWRARKATGSWRLGFENRTDLTPDERIERTVFVRAPRGVRYGEVAKVVDAVKGAGATPVGLQTDELPD